MTLANKITLIIIFGIIANIGLFMNPGYFSHDEIGWGLKAIAANNLSDIKFYNIFEYNDFHYRPLNFNLWLISSYYLYDTPQVFHLALLICGVINAILIYYIIKKISNENVAFIAALISTVMPSIVFVNGWIGTIADVFWFMCCSISFLIFLQSRFAFNNRKYLLFILACVFFTFALMFKETAVVYPAVVFLYIAYDYFFNKVRSGPSVRGALLFFLISSLIVVVYLSLRFEYLFPKQGGYGTSVSNIPIRSLEYFIFPFLLDNIEIHGLFEQYTAAQLLIAGVIHLFFIVLVCRRSVLNYLFYFAFYYVGSIPILILDMSLPHYIYTSGFTIAVSLAVIYNRSGLYKFISIILFGLLCIHSFNLQRNYVVTGVYQNNFVSTLYSVLSSNKNENCQYLIEPSSGSMSWIAVRAISFRRSIDDLVLPKDIVFNKIDLNKENHKSVCRLSLDVVGRVKLIGIDDAND
ncbi:glycosyltransferase family 39 protein [Enterobacter sp. RHBSTW-00994]|uniref:glycosyltransferase family 39 protein n=1 Tax=Enterobacter sp. RHBSTW-00994 TaxID=2742676 RepID=UPI0015EA08E4|nr:glycosyltransferase family 39 protein [Enterobacter sp. RHBSTW-00994]QLR43842.1 glycosyltransferase family 39 protein [Enterobacter sp. RHBSTW-00994]